MKALISTISDISKSAKKDHVSAFAAQSALFIIMGFVPCILLLLTIVRFTPLTASTLTDLVNSWAPDAFKSSLIEIIESVYEDAGTPLMVFSIISVLWISGKGFDALIDGLNSVFGIAEHRNDFTKRWFAVFQTIIFIVVIFLSLVLYVLGNTIAEFVAKWVPFISNIVNNILHLRVLIVIMVFSLLFTFLYVTIPHRRTKFKRMYPGALFSALGWTGFSFFFSLYVRFSRSLSLLYGSLTTIVCAMLWLYVCMFIFLLGAEVNAYLERTEYKKAIDEATDITHNHTHS